MAHQVIVDRPAPFGADGILQDQEEMRQVLYFTFRKDEHLVVDDFVVLLSGKTFMSKRVVTFVFAKKQ